ncbi:nitrilase [Pseudovirgaria hyperparasitica]|uniref:Nitrilase n=1 Tax=Pseudovirgaria hyperparasitica TaxID=470096 RepID=A0A6A6W3N5_9PEZI|nr:nitrilase [Pseudovirgaria hyperparasitica]KAF2757175.1 nitrilase [Pseudovirgaria hyperparasitica]
MPQKLKLATAQCYTRSDTTETLADLEKTTQTAAQSGVDLILFPEAYLGGYPRTCSFGASVGARDPNGREQFLQYFHSAVDLGDTPLGAGEDWVLRKLPLAKGSKFRGDGTREELEKIAKRTGVFVVTGLVEKAAGSLYCAVVYVCPREGVLGKRRKVMPTGTERLIWAQGSPSTLKAVTTVIHGVKLTLAAAICWENYMPLLRQSLYSQNVNLYLAPTADARDSWLSLMRTVGCESRAFVLSSNQCVRRRHLPSWVTGESNEKEDGKHIESTSIQGSQPRIRRKSMITAEGSHEVCWPVPEEPTESADGESWSTIGAKSAAAANDSATGSRQRRKSFISETQERHEICWPVPDGTSIPSATFTGESSDGDDFVSRGGSCIISPLGEVLAGPQWEVEDAGLLIVEADFEDCERGRLDLDVAGHYSRNDAFKLHVEGLDLNPPP